MMNVSASAENQHPHFPTSTGRYRDSGDTERVQNAERRAWFSSSPTGSRDVDWSDELQGRAIPGELGVLLVLNEQRLLE